MVTSKLFTCGTELCVSICVDIYFHFSGFIPRSEIAQSYGTSTV